ncbi:hypothetical protein GETHLI_02220 [Geothrix limicola]|uniref:Malectin domain-containing protein n=1 Tax=Geothrix limicola TaxID=2927978 RepID=A0ABQ5QC67_9BACT|nr:DUF3472 domain-containing protein [Geothrix limicola]GLH71720.1 hypothetical protein GETHLI_02220 [Geothrix limicola]
MAFEPRFPRALNHWRTLAIVAGLCVSASQAGAQDLAYNGGKGSALIFENQINVSAAVPGTYYGMIGNAWGYGGIQMNDSVTARTGIFSIWDTTEMTTEYAYNATLDIKKHGRFGGEGTGAQFLFHYDWQYGTDYRCAYRVFPEPDGIHLRFNAFFYDASLGTWVYVVTYRANTGGTALQTDRFYSFAENYANTWGNRTATMSNAWMYSAGGGWTDLTGGWIFNIPPGDQPSQSNRPDFGQILTSSQGFRFHSDTDPATRTQAEWEAVSYAPSAAEAPIVIPYFLGCGNANAQGNWEPDGYWKDVAGDSQMRSNPAPVDASDVRNPAPQAVYQNLRKGSHFQYNLIGFLPNAEYHVRLHFVEDSATARGQRLQDVFINGGEVLGRFDIFKHAGAAHKAITRSFTAKADASGQILVEFKASAGSLLPEAVVSAITATEGRPAFRLEPRSSSIEVMRGFGTQTKETVLSLNGFSSPTHLAISGLPCGVTATFSPNPVTFDSGASAVSSTLTLASSPETRHEDRAHEREGGRVVLTASSEGRTVHVPLQVSVVAPSPTFVQANESTYVDAATSLQATYASAQVAGDLNVLAVQWQDTSAHVTSVTDSSGNAYTLAVGPTQNPDQPGTQAIYYASNIRSAEAGANTVTVTFDSPAAYPDVIIADYVGVRSLGTTAAAIGSTVTLDSGAVTTDSPNELLFSATNVPWWTDAPGTGYTQRFQSDWGNIIQDRVATTPGTYNATATQNGGAPWIIQLVTFK